MFTLNEIDALLQKSRAYNIKNKISGCLFYCQDKFIQYIEGGQDDILKLYHKIMVDKRHKDIELIEYDFILERVFEDWAMYYEDFNKKNEQLEYLEMMVSLFAESSRLWESSNRTSTSFWRMVKKILLENSMR